MTDRQPSLDAEPTAEYKKWLGKLDRATRRDVRRKIRECLVAGSKDVFTTLKNVKILGGGLLEVKFRGIRVYCAVEGDMIVLLLGGTKNTRGEQNRDIVHAREILLERRALRGVGQRAHDRGG